MLDHSKLKNIETWSFEVFFIKIKNNMADLE